MGEATTITIETMKREDLDQVLIIEQESFSQPWSRNLFLAECRNPVSTLLVARQDGPPPRRVAGYIVYWIIEDEIHVLNLAVAPACRRNRIARNLVFAMLRRAQARGAKRAFLEVRASNSSARRLYSGLGFTGSSMRRNYYDGPVEDALIMTLDTDAMNSIVQGA